MPNQSYHKSKGHKSKGCGAWLRNLAILSILLGFIVACIPKIPEDYKSEDELYNYSMSLVQTNQAEDALRFLKSFRSRYPLSPRTPEVELTIADLHASRKEYLEAIDMYQQFVAFHPTHSRVNQAIFQEAVAHTKQIPSGVDRDQNELRIALEKLQMVQNDPAYSEEVKKLMGDLQRPWAVRDRYVAEYYLKRKLWSAAEVRLVSLIENYGFEDLKAQALCDLVRVYVTLGSSNEAERRLQQLIALDADSLYTIEAKKLLGK